MKLNRFISVPKVRKVIYSTCSIHYQENENVVKKALELSKGQFELETVHPQWKRRGIVTDDFLEGTFLNGMNPHSHHNILEISSLSILLKFWNFKMIPIHFWKTAKCCFRACPEEDRMIGFFIASFVRRHTSETVQNKTSQNSSLNLIEKTNNSTSLQILPKKRKRNDHKKLQKNSKRNRNKKLKFQ